MDDTVIRDGVVDATRARLIAAVDHAETVCASLPADDRRSTWSSLLRRVADELPDLSPALAEEVEAQPDEIRELVALAVADARDEASLQRWGGPDAS